MQVLHGFGGHAVGLHGLKQQFGRGLQQPFSIIIGPSSISLQHDGLHELQGLQGFGGQDVGLHGKQQLGFGLQQLPFSIISLFSGCAGT